MNPLQTAKTQLQIVVNALLLHLPTDDVDEAYPAAKHRVWDAYKDLDSFICKTPRLNVAVGEITEKLGIIRGNFDDPMESVDSHSLASELGDIINDLGHINSAVRLREKGVDIYGDPVEVAK